MGPAPGAVLQAGSGAYQGAHVGFVCRDCLPLLHRLPTQSLSFPARVLALGRVEEEVKDAAVHFHAFAKASSSPAQSLTLRPRSASDASPARLVARASATGHSDSLSGI